MQVCAVRLIGEVRVRADGWGREVSSVSAGHKDGREGNVSRGEVAEDGRGVDDGCASLVELEVVERDRRVGKEGREGISLGGGKISLLKAKDVGGGEEVAETGGDDVATEDEIGRCARGGQAVDVVRNNTGDGQGKIGEKEEGGGRVSRMEGTAKH